MKPVDMDTCTDSSILGDKVFDSLPVLDMGRVLVDPYGTLRSHKVTWMWSLGIDEPACFLADCKQASRAQCQIGKESGGGDLVIALIQDMLIIQDVICKMIHARLDALTEGSFDRWLLHVVVLKRILMNAHFEASHASCLARLELAAEVVKLPL